MSERDNYPDYIERVYEFIITGSKTPERLDVYLTNNIRNATRTRVQKAIDDGCVTVNNKISKMEQDLQLVKFGVNYHFNPLPVVVAKY